MRLTRPAALTAAAIGLAAGMMAAAPAQATPSTALSADGAAALATQLGTRTGGVYLDASGKMVVTVTDAAAAETVRVAGAIPKLVTRSAAQLDAVRASLDSTAAAHIPGTSWAVDPATNQVVVSADSTVSAAKLAALQSLTQAFGQSVRVERTAGTLSTFIAGGDAIYSSGYRCSLGFNTRNSAGTYYFLTAGHCGNLGAYWYSNSSLTTLIGTRRGSSFPTNDYAIITYASGITHPGTVDLYNGTSQDITAAGNAYVGQSVRRSGSTTHVHSGTVTALNATVNYSQGTVYGMIQTTVCAEGGDSGGSLFAGSTALGLTSGGSGNCTTGGTTFFQPVTEPLSVYGVSVY